MYEGNPSSLCKCKPPAHQNLETLTMKEVVKTEHEKFLGLNPQPRLRKLTQ